MNISQKPGKLFVMLLAAGQGKRMGGVIPKPLYTLCGRPMLLYVLEQGLQAAKHDFFTPHNNDSPIVVVVEPLQHDFQSLLGPQAVCIKQKNPQGTAHAVQCGLEALQKLQLSKNDHVMIMLGDVPLIQTQWLKGFIDAYAKSNAGGMIAAINPHRTTKDAQVSYGKIVIDERGYIQQIIEAKEQEYSNHETHLYNSGLMLMSAEVLTSYIKHITPSAVTNEYYLTDLVGIAYQNHHPFLWHEGDCEDLLGVNTPQEAEHAKNILQQRWCAALQQKGVVIDDTQHVTLHFDTCCDEGVRIEPYVVFGPNVHVKAYAHIRSFSYISHSSIGAHSIIGPFAHIDHANCHDNATIGNFVEVRRSCIGDSTKAKHLAYIGDATIGCKTNVGAGTIICNYDGKSKHHTRIGENVFIGSNTTIVASQSFESATFLENDSFIAAGSVITKPVAQGTMGIARSSQETRRLRQKR